MGIGSIIIVASVVSIVIGFAVAGFKRTIRNVMPGLYVLAVGLGLTALSQATSAISGGYTIFIGAMVVGAALIVIGAFRAIFGRDPA